MVSATEDAIAIYCPVWCEGSAPIVSHGVVSSGILSICS